MLDRFPALRVLVAIAAAVASGTAWGGPVEMFLSSGGYTTTLQVGTGSPSSASFTGSLPDGWTINPGTMGTSGPGNLVLGANAATCTGTGGCTSNALTIVISATGFPGPVAANQFNFALDATSIVGGTLTSTAYVDASNSYFCNAGDEDQGRDDQGHDGDGRGHDGDDSGHDGDDRGHDGDDSGHDGIHDEDDAGETGGIANQCGPTNAIGTLTLSSANQPLSLLGGPDPLRPYSLTISETFTPLGSGDPGFVATTSVTRVSEPGTLALFGAGLLGCALLGRRRRRARAV